MSGERPFSIGWNRRGPLRPLILIPLFAMMNAACITGGSQRPTDREPLPVSVSIEAARGWRLDRIIEGARESGVFHEVQVAAPDLVLRLSLPHARTDSSAWETLELPCLLTIVGFLVGPCRIDGVVNEYFVDVLRGDTKLSRFKVEGSVVSWNTVWNDPPEKRLFSALSREVGLELGQQFAAQWPRLSAKLAEPANGLAISKPPPSRSELVAAIQRGLAKLDYYEYEGEPDGLLHEDTASAIANFQRDRGIETDGKASRALLQQIAFANPRNAAKQTIIREKTPTRPSPRYTGSQSRIALVIGNSRYTNTARLANPSGDARAIAGLLDGLGFETQLVLDADVDEFQSALRVFGSRSEKADIALFYYAGHAIQVAGQNHLVPVNARLERQSDLAYDAIPLDLVMEEISRSAAAQILILDACRDNPFAGKLSASLSGTRSMGNSRGLAVMSRGAVGTLIAYATAPDSVAADGSGKHSPYTDALLRWLPEPGLEISEVFRKVRIDVIRSTGQQQIPWENSSLVGDGIYLSGK